MILVTGGVGLTGSFVTKELLRRGQDVRILARTQSAEQAKLLGAEVVIGDLNDTDSLAKVTQGVQGVVHVAYTMIGTKDSRSEIDIAAMNVLLEAWDQGPFVYISSVDVYGYPKWVPVTEDHPLHENYSDYGRGKVKCEELLRIKALERGRNDFSILRPGNIFGPHLRCRNRLIGQTMLEGQPFELPGRTKGEWSKFGDSWIDARDLAWIVAECLITPLGEAFNAVNGDFLWHDVFARLIELVGSQSQIIHKDLNDFPNEVREEMMFLAQTWRYSGQRLKQKLGFHPSHLLYNTLDEIAAFEF